MGNEFNFNFCWKKFYISLLFNLSKGLKIFKSQLKVLNIMNKK